MKLTSLFVSLEALKCAFHLAVEWKVRISDDEYDDFCTNSKVEKLAPMVLNAVLWDEKAKLI